MMKRGPTLALVVAACAFAFACAGDDKTPPAASSTPSYGTVDAAGLPPEAVEFASDWPLPNQNAAGTRSAVGSPISSATVSRLKVAWEYDVPGHSQFGNLATTPLIVGDTVFAEDLTGILHAVDRETGHGRWTAGIPGTLFGPTGVAVGWGKVFGTVAGADGRGRLIAAFDIDTGKQLWSTDVSAATGGEINVQPFVAGGLVFASTSGFPQGVRGTIIALNQESGDIVWSFSTVESEDLWGNRSLNHGGGTWYPPALDVTGNTLFFGVGNPYPFPGATGFPAGSSRPGDNRWTSGTVALDTATGALRWGFQAFPHDLFDRDHIIAIAASEDVLVTAGKGGVVIGLEPSTGKVLWSTDVGRHENDGLTSFDSAVRVLPGGQGGIVTPAAVADGVFYAAVVNAPITYTSDEETSYGFGTRLGTMPSDIVAVNIKDGTVLWDVEITPEGSATALDQVVLGGATVVNDLVFTSTLSGRIIALDRATGNEVWSYQAPGGINGWPAVAGDLIVFPVGFGGQPQLLALRLGPEEQ